MCSNKPSTRLDQLVKILDLAVTMACLQNRTAAGSNSARDHNNQQVLDSIATFGRFTSEQAIRVRPLATFASNASVMKYIEKFRALPVFRAELYFQPRPGYEVSLDLIECFGNGSDSKKHENTLDDRKELHAIALNFSASARDNIVHIFLPIAAVLSSLCSFMPHKISLDSVIDVLSRYLLPTWQSPLAQSHYIRSSIEFRLAEGWSLVSETVKVLCQELALSSICRPDSPDEQTSSDGEIDQNTCITEEKVVECIPIWYQRVLSEFLAWVYVLFEGTVEKDDFVEAVGMLATPLLASLLKDVNCERSRNFDVGMLRESILKIEEGNPTMAEVIYDVNTMTPTLKTKTLGRKVTWKLGEVFKRCRHPFSPVLDQSKSASLRKPGMQPVYAETVEGEHRPMKKHSLQDRDYVCTEDEDETRKRRTKRARTSRFDDLTDTAPGSNGNAQLALPALTPAPVHAAHEIVVDESVVHVQTTQQVAEKPVEQSGTEAQQADVEDDNDGDIAESLGEALETFYNELTSWNPGPPSSPQGMNTEHLAYGNDVWLKNWADTHKDAIKRDATLCESMEEYGNHWKPLVMMELRGSVASEIKKVFSSAKNQSPNLLDEFHHNLFQFRINVIKVSHSRKLTHLTCHANDHDLRRRLAKDLQGGVVCVGYVLGENDLKRSYQPDLSIIACRSVNWDDEEYVFGATGSRGDDIPDLVEMKLTINRARFRTTRIMAGNTVYIVKLATYSPYARMFKSLHECKKMLPKIRRVLCNVKADPREAGGDESNITPLSDQEKNIVDLERNVDPGCKEYLGALRKMDILNSSQHIAVLAALASMGDCGVGASSISMIKGPPGTGKTDCITFLIGALMHHSRYGQVGIPGYEPVDALLGKFKPCKPDGILRHSSNRTSFSFLVTASSNNAVDNVMLRVKERGIMGKDGTIIRPEMCRVARQNYNYGGLSNMSLNARALPYNQLHHPNVKKNSASSKAIDSYRKECILYFATLTTVAGPQWKSVKAPIDVVVIDEGAHPNEPEAVLAFIATRRHSYNRRTLSVLVGDNNQLVVPPLCLQLIREHKLTMPFDYGYQMRSLFERLLKSDRATCCMLLVQYRMHPDIADMHFGYFYDGLVRSGLPVSHFLDVYNRGPGVNGGFAPFTCIDTSQCQRRYERKEEAGKYFNQMEIEVIDDVLWNLYKIVGKDLDKLNGRIAVLIPYRSQLENVREQLKQYQRFVHFAARKCSETDKQFNIKIHTSDGMQGDERDIVIFAATRSNESHEVGFLKDRRRLNVAMSRMKKLMVFIGDFSTLSSTEAEYFHYVDRVTQQGEFSADRKIWNGRDE